MYMSVPTFNIPKKRRTLPKKSNSEHVQNFWSSPKEAFFRQDEISAVINKSVKTLEADRWRGVGIPYRKVGGRVLYQKQDVVNWLESHKLVNSTSEYNKESNHD